MGTRWEGVLAPINQPTGDGRRMAVGAFSHRPLPLPLRWQRPETQGHDDAVVVGSIDKIRIDDEAGHVWGEGELFDDVNPATSPQLAEDVASAVYLLDKKVIGPSVDPGHASAVAVLAGTDDHVTDELVRKLMMKGATEMPPTETLFTAYEIAGATLVPVPAFAECRPFTLLRDATTALTASAATMDRTSSVAALVRRMPPEELFADPKLARITPITYRDMGGDWVHVFGHLAEHGTCLVGQRGVCTTPPYSEREYSSFHRYHDADELVFPLPVGRLTAGFGTLENTCRCCPGNDDHACANISFGAAVAHHDRMQPLAYVRVGEDEQNNAIWFSGILAPGVDERGMALLRRQKISGDWRDVAGGMELSEVLILNRRNPGFPLPRATMRGGRARALTAAGVIYAPLANQQQTVEGPPEADPQFAIDYARLGQEVAAALVAAAGTPTLEDVIEQTRENIREDAREFEDGNADPEPEDVEFEDDDEFDDIDDDELVEDDIDGNYVAVTAAAAPEGGHTGAMLALRMTDQDAARLCVHDGLPMDELHSTLAYLGEADKITPEVREQMIKDVTKLAAGMQPFEVEAADITVFNPGTNNDREPALVLGLTGDTLAELHGNVSAMSWDGYEMPGQFSPYKPHITLRQPAGDISRVEAVADRMGPVTFDRLRLAFGGEVTDIPLGGVTQVGGGYDISSAESMMGIDHERRARAAVATLSLHGLG
jgi:2'-5' RNA ligase